MQQRFLFINVGWMPKYEGRKGETITGGGTFVSERGYGAEALNFKPRSGRMFGHGQPPGKPPRIRVENLGGHRRDSKVHGITVVWVSKSRIVGWYRNVTVYREVQRRHLKGRSYKGNPIPYNIEAKASNCQRIDPPDARIFTIPRGKSGKARVRHIWYASGAKYTAFLEKVEKYIKSGGHLAGNTTKKASPHGVSRQPDPKTRKRIEEIAIERTTAYYKELGYDVGSVEKDNVGWDLNAVHQGAGTSLKLEVKGLSGAAISVEMTPNEYTMLRQHKDNYRLCVVTRCLEHDKRALSVFSITESGQWADERGRPIQIRELTAARLFV
jgi:Domain of unknown function (DUF3883)